MPFIIVALGTPWTTASNVTSTLVAPSAELVSNICNTGLVPDLSTYITGLGDTPVVT